MRIVDILLHWDQQSWKTRLLVGVPFALAVLGWFYYDQSNEAQKMHTRMIGMCSGDQACVAAVNLYAESCFKDHYHMSRSWHGVRTAEFVSCVNDKSGVQYFTAEKQ